MINEMPHSIENAFQFLIEILMYKILYASVNESQVYIPRKLNYTWIHIHMYGKGQDSNYP